MGFLPSKPWTILHISDLHLGRSNINKKITRSSKNTQDFILDPLWARLWKSAVGQKALHQESNFCIVTGDLSRTSPDRTIFEAIRDSLMHYFPMELSEGNDARRWMAIPGNHDRKKWGNFCTDYKTFDSVLTDWREPWWIPGVPLIIIPVDSNPSDKKGKRTRWALNFARGCVGAAEMDHIKASIEKVIERIKEHVGRQLNELSLLGMRSLALRLAAALSSEELLWAYQGGTKAVPSSLHSTMQSILAEMVLARSVRCVLLHHHPVGVADSENLGLTNQDAYMTLVDAGDFLRCARDQRINLLCHGHKHMPHRLVVGLPGAEHVAVVGAGSTTCAGKHDSATANVIHITSDGQIKVQLHRPGKEGWEQTTAPLEIPSWPAIKRHLQQLGEACCRYITAGSVNAEVYVMSEGDALLTIELRDIVVKPEARAEDGSWEIPLHIEAATHLGIPKITFTKGSAASGNFAGQPKLETLYHTPNEWNGRVKVYSAGTNIPPFSVSYQFVAFSTFASNQWQFACLYKDQRQTEFYRWRCFIPIRERIATTVHSEIEMQFPRPIYDNVDETEDPAEIDGLLVEESVTRKEALLIAQKPVWGSRYGLEWTVKYDVSAQFDTGTEALRIRLANAADLVKKGTRSLFHKELCQLLEDFRAQGTQSAPDTELMVFVVDRQLHPAKLRPLAWSDSVENEDEHQTEFNIGVGVAGRAAWRAKVTAWVSTAHTKYDQWANCYFPMGGKIHHHALLAIPLPRSGEHPVAVLSIATRKQAMFATLVEQKMAESYKAQVDNPVDASYVHRINDLCEAVEKLLQTEGQR